MESFVKITWDNFEDMLIARREDWNDGNHKEIPDCVWEFVMDLLREDGGLRNPEYNDPRYIVDNLLVNGSWEDFDEVRRWNDAFAGYENDLDLAQALEDDGQAIAVFRSEKIVLWNTGL